MLISLSVNNLAIADHLEIPFKQGMTVLTGETGAGKSIILDALGLALGDRADSTLVRHGCSRTDIYAEFDLSSHPKTRQWLIDNDLDADDQCIMRRSVTAEGRSRSYINGHPCTLQTARQIGEQLIDIHSQHEHQSLLNRDNHRGILDNYGKLENQSLSTSRLFEQWQNKRQALENLESNQEELQARLQLLSFQVEELDTLALQEGELELLEQEQSTLANAEQLLQASNQAITLCSDGDQDATTAISQAIRTLENLPSQNPLLSEALQMLNEAQVQIDEAASSLRHFNDNFEMDPARLAEVEERLSSVYQLARKHKCDPLQLTDIHFQLSEELKQYQGGGQNLDQLKAETLELETAFLQAAEKLSEARKKAARELDSKIAKQLEDMEMKSVRFYTQLERMPPAHFTRNGIDRIEFLVSTNPGTPPRPLNKIASGGELSRLSLAIQVAIAERSRIPTLVFDEVDVGIGGSTAHMVGRLLKELGKKGQIICVTHQAQVASQGDHHLFISKTVRDNAAYSQVDRLTDEQRVEEVARMISGASLTDQTLAHAREMLGK